MAVTVLRRPQPAYSRGQARWVLSRSRDIESWRVDYPGMAHKVRDPISNSWPYAGISSREMLASGEKGTQGATSARETLPESEVARGCVENL